MPHYLFRIITGSVADDSDKSGGLGAMLTNVAQTSELSIAQNMETASQNEKVRKPFDHTCPSTGVPGAIQDGLPKPSRESSSAAPRASPGPPTTAPAVPSGK